MHSRPLAGRRVFLRLLAPLTLSAGLLAAAGCAVPRMSKPAVAFNQATRTVIDGSEDAYGAANRLHHDVMIARAVADYDKNPQWSPYNDIKPLLTPDQFDARLKVLDGLKAYAATLVALTTPKKKQNEALDAAAAGVGSNLQGVGATLSTSFGTVKLSDEASNGISTAVDALGLFLIDHTTQRSLKDVTQKMDPNITALCHLLDSDIVVLRRQADVDYQDMITGDDQLIRHATVDTFTHRAQVGRLIDLAAEQKANDQLLEKLQTAIQKLGTAHTALTEAVRSDHPESVKQAITELSAAGERLATFYKSLSSSTPASSSTQTSSTPGA